jgi:2-dehydro-3-deoxygalactonokinase
VLWRNGEAVVGEIEWIGVDWGTTNLRAWGMDADGSVVATAESDNGMGRLKPGEFPAALAQVCGDMAQDDSAVDVVICGMAGARQGWLEAPYLDTPADLGRLALGAVRPPDASGPLRVRILPGVCQRGGSEDVMRGEETQLLGLQTLQPNFSGTVIMPGTHSKWATLENGRLVRFSTSMTGELFAVLGTQSVLRHSLGDGGTDDELETGMQAGLMAGLGAPERLGALLFRTRAAALLSGKSAKWCRGYLSGTLVGAEVSGMGGWVAGQPSVPLIGSPRLGEIYAQALRHLGIAAETIDATQATLAGLGAARQQEPA